MSTRFSVGRILIDVTIAATTKHQTGIQRVVRNIARHAETVGPQLGVECIPVVCHGENMTAVGFDGSRRWDERFFTGIADSWMSANRGMGRLLESVHVCKQDSYMGLLSRLRKLFVPKTPARWIKNSYYKLTRQQVQMKDGDLLLLLDASWNLPIEKIAAQGANCETRLATVVYDLIPVRHPQFHQAGLRSLFRKWLEIVVQQSDVMTGISDTVRDDLKQFVAETRAQAQAQDQRSTSPMINSFRLGADFQSNPTRSDQGAAAIADALQEKLGIQDSTADRKIFLNVGTLEPRKNHSFLLDAFDHIWKVDPSIKLCLVGKVGWMCEQLMDRIHQHPQFNKSLFHFSSASDDELAWLYENSTAMVFPSIVEGFGLPIVESLHHGLPVLASDTPIHREVGTDQCQYFSLDSVDDLVEQLRNIVQDETSLQAVEYKNHVSWEESCHQLLAGILNSVQGEASKNSCGDAAKTQGRDAGQLIPGQSREAA